MNHLIDGKKNKCVKEAWTMGINELVNQLYEARLAEQAAKEYRVGLEAQLAEKLGVPDSWEGTQTRGVGKFRVKLTRFHTVLRGDAVVLLEDDCRQVGVLHVALCNGYSNLEIFLCKKFAHMVLYYRLVK